MPKQIKLLVTAAFGIIILGGILFFAEPKQSPKPANRMAVADLAIDPQSYDFGTISMKNGPVNKSFIVKNGEAGSILLSSLYTSCMCTSAKISIAGLNYGPFGMAAHGGNTRLNQRLETGQTAELVVTFDPSAHGPSGVGPIERIVTLETVKGRMAQINIKADVVP